MPDFLQAVFDYPFMRNAVSAGLLAALACGVIGSFVVARRITYVAGGIAHSVLGGMGVAGYLIAVRQWDVLSPLYGAIVSALLAALIIGWVTVRARQREDTVIGAVWAVGMAVGILFISQTPGYNQELMSYLFGNILMVSDTDLSILIALDILIVVLTYLYYRQVLAVCFDPDFARARGMRVHWYYMLLLCLTALTVVLLVTVVGIVLVIALLTLPAAVAGCLSRTFRQMMFGAIACCVFFTLSGLAVSYQSDFPAGATIILIAGACYGLAMAVRWLAGRFRAGLVGTE
ncbi:MAG: metal ABC transporter permease [candidate division Zixibacteria bacterium]|nr:metal ABC transporter permease [candidate division Zixibacteria bacterium]MDH3938236.1 metal ABC transporter permease [candidate division Zixibacteria bacterium]MDH4033291.1 metal ABC transporter permease [candidate division Zixibacteria bacterium]